MDDWDIRENTHIFDWNCCPVHYVSSCHRPLQISFYLTKNFYNKNNTANLRAFSCKRNFCIIISSILRFLYDEKFSIAWYFCFQILSIVSLYIRLLMLHKNTLIIMQIFLYIYIEILLSVLIKKYSITYILSNSFPIVSNEFIFCHFYNYKRKCNWYNTLII